ncbi:hypothetical protein SAMN04487781_1261 [Cellulosimicrobium cellulans]|nr:hypothetical protein SAMN04487781_1261 [Cellulosimicrobium cellulans]
MPQVRRGPGPGRDHNDRNLPNDRNHRIDRNVQYDRSPRCGAPRSYAPRIRS